MMFIPRGMTKEDIVLRVIVANKRAGNDILITEIEQKHIEAKGI
jgi:hypothetical protein